MYIGHARLCVCLCICVTLRGRIPTLLHGPGCNLGQGRCALLGGFAIGARVSLLWQQPEREMSASACTRSAAHWISWLDLCLVASGDSHLLISAGQAFASCQFFTGL